MTQEPDWRLIDRYIAGTATPAEAEHVERWRDAAPGRRELIERARNTGAPAAQWNADAAWNRVAARTVQAAQRPAVRGDVVPLHRTAPVPSRWSPAVWGLAAAAVLVLSVGTWQVVGARHDATPPRVATAALRGVAVPRGTRASLTLGDGTRVTLNAGTRLQYRSDIDRGARDVYLDGEAFFVVTHDAARPFRVHAARSVVQDVGTRFDVRAYADAAEVTVAVAEGVVALRPDSSTRPDSALLTAGMLARVGMNAGSMTVRHADVSRMTAWTEERLVLDDVTLGAAIPVLERWFDVDIRLADTTLSSRRVSADFHGESLTTVLSALSTALELEFRLAGRRVTIARHGGAP